MKIKKIELLNYISEHDIEISGLESRISELEKKLDPPRNRRRRTHSPEKQLFNKLKQTQDPFDLTFSFHQLNGTIYLGVYNSNDELINQFPLE